nr:MAG TPA: hypothetical protein [Caudoviricetes sp.]
MYKKVQLSFYFLTKFSYLWPLQSINTIINL